MVVGSPSNRNVPKAKSVEEVVDSTLSMCWSILGSEHMVTPSIHIASILNSVGTGINCRGQNVASWIYEKCLLE